MKSHDDPAPRSPAAGPLTGVGGTGTTAHVVEKRLTVPAQEHPSTLPLAPLVNTRSKSGSHHPCEGVQANGQPCGMPVSIQVVLGDGHTTAWRCRHHRKDCTPLKDVGPVLPHPPVTNLRTKADAERFMQWLLKAASQNAYNASQIKGMLMIVGRWDRVRQRWEETLSERINGLYARMRGEIKAVREELKQNGDDDGSDDDGIPRPGGSLGERADKLDELIGYWREEMKRITRDRAA